jgi:replicative DNA helicase
MPTDLTIEKSLPHSPEAERAVLGAILLENSLFDQTSEMLTREDFYLENHRNIFSTMERLSSDTRTIDLLTLREELQKQNELEAVGGVAYVAALLDGVPRVSSVMHYARIVKEKSLLRKLIHSANEILVRGFSNEEDPLELLERLREHRVTVRAKRAHLGRPHWLSAVGSSHLGAEACRDHHRGGPSRLGKDEFSCEYCPDCRE